MERSRIDGYAKGRGRRYEGRHKLRAVKGHKPIAGQVAIERVRPSRHDHSRSAARREDDGKYEDCNRRREGMSVVRHSGQLAGPILREPELSLKLQ